MGRKANKQKKLGQCIEKKAVTIEKGSSFPLDRTVMYLLVIMAFGMLAYANTFSVPFQWDEGSYIIENPVVKDLGYFSDTSKAAQLGKEFAKKALYLKSRYVGYLTFALNYWLHGFNVFGYHVVNLFIHILNAFLVYFLVLLTFRTPFMNKADLRINPRTIGLFSALIFVVHPIQTEAVTYIYQRITSLVAFFYLLALVLYIKARIKQAEAKVKNEIKTEKHNELTSTSASTLTFYFLSLVSVVLAMKTKENAFTLPFVILLYEFFFFSDDIKKRALRLLPFVLTLSIIPLMLIDVQKPLGEMLDDIGEVTARTRVAMLRTDYLFTEFRVIVTYLRILVYPANQNLDYYYLPSHSFFEPQVIYSFLLLSAIAGLGIWLFLKSRQGKPAFRLIAFGIFWFFITLAIESSIFPINMVIDEYRAYLPSAGIFMAAATGIILIWPRITIRSYFAILLIAAGIFTTATYRRNAVWKTSESLWSDVVQKAPLNARAHNNLANARMKEGKLKQAIEGYLRTIKLEPDHVNAHNNICFAYRLQGDMDKAIEHCERALRLNPDKSKVYNNLGNAYAAKGMYDKAIENFLVALKHDPEYADTHNNLGAAYMYKGMPELALEQYQIALRLNPEYADAHSNLGNVYMSTKRPDDAIREYLIALRLNPRHADAHNNLGVAYFIMKNMGEAEKHFRTAYEINPLYADPHLNLGRLYLSERDFARAEKEFITALRLNPQLTPARQFLEMLRNRRG